MHSTETLRSRFEMTSSAAGQRGCYTAVSLALLAVAVTLVSLSTYRFLRLRSRQAITSQGDHYCRAVVLPSLNNYKLRHGRYPDDLRELGNLHPLPPSCIDGVLGGRLLNAQGIPTEHFEIEYAFLDHWSLGLPVIKRSWDTLSRSWSERVID